MSMRIGIIGTGFMGAQHARCLQRIEAIRHDRPTVTPARAGLAAIELIEAVLAEPGHHRSSPP